MLERIVIVVMVRYAKSIIKKERKREERKREERKRRKRDRIKPGVERMKRKIKSVTSE